MKNTFIDEYLQNYIEDPKKLSKEIAEIKLCITRLLGDKYYTKHEFKEDFIYKLIVSPNFLELISKILIKDPNNKIANNLMAAIKIGITISKEDKDRGELNINYFDISDSCSINAISRKNIIKDITTNSFNHLKDKERISHLLRIKLFPYGITDLKYFFLTYYPSKVDTNLKIGKAIQKLFPLIKSSEIETFVSFYKKENTINTVDCEFKIIKGEEICFFYNINNYANQTEKSGDTLSQSCMRYDGKGENIKFYSYFPDKIQLGILTNKQRKLVARCIIWNADDGNTYYDRIFSSNEKIKLYFITELEQKGFKPCYPCLGDNFFRDVEVTLYKVNAPKPNIPYLDTLNCLKENTCTLFSTYHKDKDKIRISDINSLFTISSPSSGRYEYFDYSTFNYNIFNEEADKIDLNSLGEISDTSIKKFLNLVQKVKLSEKQLKKETGYEFAFGKNLAYSLIHKKFINREDYIFCIDTKSYIKKDLCNICFYPKKCISNPIEYFELFQKKDIVNEIEEIINKKVIYYYTFESIYKLKENTIFSEIYNSYIPVELSTTIEKDKKGRIICNRYEPIRFKNEELHNFIINKLKNLNYKPGKNESIFRYISNIKAMTFVRPNNLNFCSEYIKKYYLNKSAVVLEKKEIIEMEQPLNGRPDGNQHPF